MLGDTYKYHKALKTQENDQSQNIPEDKTPEKKAEFHWKQIMWERRV